MYSLTSSYPNLTIGLWNCNSIKKHKTEISKLLSQNYTFLCINETELAKKDNIHFNNYNITRNDRNSHGGGVLILSRIGIEFERLNNLDKFNLELVALKVKLKNSFINIITVYVPPRKSNQDKFIDSSTNYQLWSLLSSVVILIVIPNHGSALITTKTAFY